MAITKLGKEVFKGLDDIDLAPATFGAIGTSGVKKGVGEAANLSIRKSDKGAKAFDETKEFIDKMKNSSNIEKRVGVGYSSDPLSIKVKDYNALTDEGKKGIEEIFGPQVKKTLEDGNDFVATTADKATASHELGHVTGKLSDSPLYNKAVRFSKHLGNVPTLAAPAAAALASREGESDLVEKGVTYGPAAAVSPMLFEEGRATTRGLNMIRKAEGLGQAVKKAPKLGLAGATYGTLAASPIIANKLTSYFSGEGKKE